MVKNILVVCTLLLITSTLIGCKRYVHIHDRYPQYDAPPKAEIHQISSDDIKCLDPVVREKIVNSVQNLKVEASQLRAILNSYNDYAQRKNAEYDDIFK